MSDDIRINKRLTDLIGKEEGLFGHVNTWGLRPTSYEFIGYELSIDFLPTLQNMSQVQKDNLKAIMAYFEIHAKPLKLLLEKVQNQKGSTDTIFIEMAWSHFMTVIMFGMLEVAVKITTIAELNEFGGLKNKGNTLKLFLEKNLSQDIKDSIVKRYRVESFFAPKKIFTSFSDVVEHIWQEIRSGFIHEAGLQSKGMEWTTLGEGLGTESDPIKIKSDVPMPEWLQIAWQAILNSYGYKGFLRHPKYKKN